MKSHSTSVSRCIRLGLVGISLAVGMAIGVIVVSAFGENSIGASSQTGNSGFPLNAYGMTYGSAANVSLESEPTLIFVDATNGAKGYVYRSELWQADGTDVNSPAEAAKYMDSATHPRFLPVYLSDGKTVVGQFEIPAVVKNPVGAVPPDFPNQTK